MSLSEIPILQYINVSARAHLHEMWLPSDGFRGQMSHLAQDAFSVLTIDGGFDVMERKSPVPQGRPICVTFENGYEDLEEHAFPVLAEHGLPCALFVSPDDVGTERTISGETVRYLSWSKLRSLVSQGVTVGAFESTCLNIEDVPREQLKEHVVTFRKRLEDELGVEIRYFAAKTGKAPDEVRDLLQETGYRAFLTQCPIFRKPDLFSVPRIQVDDDDHSIFLTKISKTYLALKDKAVWKYIRKYGLDRVGHRLSETYDKLRGW